MLSRFGLSRPTAPGHEQGTVAGKEESGARTSGTMQPCLLDLVLVAATGQAVRILRHGAPSSRFDSLAAQLGRCSRTPTTTSAECRRERTVLCLLLSRSWLTGSSGTTSTFSCADIKVASIGGS